MDASTKMSAARTRLILDKPFLGALALRLPLVEASQDWCPTTWSNGKSLYFNPAYIDSLDVAQTQFALSREALHCGLLHFYRRASRAKKLWETACDFAVNPILMNDGLKPTPDTVSFAEFDGLTAEEIYPLLKDNEWQQDGSDAENDDNQSSMRQPQPQEATLTSAEMEVLAAQWRQRLAAAAQQSMQAGKLSADIARLVDFFLQPRLPWRVLLAQYLSATARNDYSYTRPSSRRGDPAVFPGMRSEQIDLVVAVDTSGSIREEEIEEFFTEINAIKGQIRARVILLCCDEEIAGGFPKIFEVWDDFSFGAMVKGGGGTDFRPVFKWIENQDIKPDALLYFSDGHGTFPAEIPHYPVVWLIKGGQTVPFGTRVQLND